MILHLTILISKGSLLRSETKSNVKKPKLYMPFSFPIIFHSSDLRSVLDSVHWFEVTAKVKLLGDVVVAVKQIVIYNPGLFSGPSLWGAGCAKEM
jgi:hypothetical protein